MSRGPWTWLCILDDAIAAGARRSSLVLPLTVAVVRMGEGRVVEKGRPDRDGVRWWYSRGQCERFRKVIFDAAAETVAASVDITQDR